MSDAHSDVVDVAPRYTKIEAAAKRARKRQLWVLEQQKSTHFSTVAIGVVLTTFIVVAGGAMIVCATVYGLRDLYIPGALFLAGGVVFVLCFGIANCKHYFVKRRVHARLEEAVAKAENRTE